MNYTVIRDVGNTERLENGHHYAYTFRVFDLIGNGFADLTPEEYLTFTEDIKFRLYQKGLHILDVRKIDNYELEFVGKYNENSITAILVIIVIGIALMTFGLWIVRHNIKEVAVASGLGFSFGILLLIGVFFFGLIKRGKG